MKRKLTGVVDAFLREACDRIETHDQYEVIQIRRDVRRKEGMPSKCVSSCRLYLRFCQIQGIRNSGCASLTTNHEILRARVCLPKEI